MKNISPALNTHLQSEVTTLATCWKLTRRDATVLGFTSHDTHIVFESVTYLAQTGFTPSAIESSVELGKDSLNTEGMLDADIIKEKDILAGIFDFAEIEIFQVNYTDLSQGALKLRRGWLGEVSLKQHQFVAEIMGLSTALDQRLGELYSPACRANLGDARCKVNLAGFTQTGTVDSVSSNALFLDPARTEAAGYFSQGKITFNSGLNAGLSMEVKDYFPGTVTLIFPMPYNIVAGDSYTIIAGCDKTLATCKTKFSNVINFRGEPFLPGIDKILETSSTRSGV